MVRDLCRRYGTLFIADEVACGFGRTTRLFACEHFGLDPDMLCVAKAMSGGLAPIGAVIATAPIARSMEENDGAFYSTYGWHPRWTFWRARYDAPQAQVVVHEADEPDVVIDLPHLAIDG